MKIAMTGSSGLIGKKLTKRLEDLDHQVIPMTRKRVEAGIYWSPSKSEIDGEQLEGLDALIHLAGEPIAGGRWTEEKKKKIAESRVKGSELLAHAIARLNQPPKIFLSASAVGYYGDRGSEQLTEASSPGTGFLAEVCVDWENAAKPIADCGTRLAFARLGIVLSEEGGALKQMLLPFKLGLGGKLGSGEQFMSWIDIEDVVEGMCFILEQESASGAFNFTAPKPVQQKEFAELLADRLKRPSLLQAPEFLMKAALGEMADELLLASMRAYPERLLNLGYSFRSAELSECLKRHLA